MSFLLDEEKTWTQRDFGLDGRLLKAMSKLGFIYPTMVQAKCIPIALQGKDVLVRARTGSGKTLAFSLPVLHKLLIEKTGKQVETNRIRALVLAPTKELCKQIEKHILDVLYYCKDTISICSLSDDSTSVQQYRLKSKPDIVITTPARIVQHIKAGSVDLSNVHSLVIDEADLILSFGYAEDVQLITSKMPKIFQGLLMSATLSPELDKFKRVLLHNPAVLKLEESQSVGHLLQFYLKSSEADKYLTLYVFLKLGLLQGKGLIFVNDVDKCYKLKLFLQQFFISAAVLNAEVPLNSRIHILEEYNRGVFDYLIATDASIDQGEEAEDDSDDERDPSFDYGDEEDNDNGNGDSEEEIVQKGKKRKHSLDKQKTGKASKSSKEADTKKTSKADYGVSRGIDFQGVTFVVNFDTPKTSAAYTHRIGRTARGGASGTALTFVTSANPKFSPKWEVDAAARDALVLQQVRSQQPRLGTVEGDNVLAAIGSVHSDSMSEEDKMQPAPLIFNVNELDNFRYRVEDTLRSVTPAAVKELRAAEIKREILNSAQLKSYFAENPNDLKVLRHDKAIKNPITPKEHLKYIPDYLVPQSMKGIVTGNSGGNRPKRRKSAQSSLSVDKKVQNSKMKDPLLNPPTSSGEVASAPMESTVAWSDSQNYSTSGRLQWKARHKRGEFNPKNKSSRSPGTFTRGKKLK